VDKTTKEKSYSEVKKEHNSKLIERKQCPKCAQEGNDQSRNNLGVYSDGHTYCFAGHGLISDTQEVEPLTEFTYQTFDWRCISKDTFKAYGVSFKVDMSGRPHSVVFPYGDAATKERLLDSKQFFSTGAMNEASLFGMDRFSAGSARAITITEGELDALSVYQILGSKYPAVSVRGASSARRDCERARDYLNSFEKIYLCFDNDEPGIKATKDVAQLFDVNKVVHVKLDRYKDANEYLTKNAGEEFKRIWWNSKGYMPKGIINDFDSIEKILKEEDSVAAATYPFQTLQSMTYGMRLGEVVLVTAQEKHGKTEFIRSIEYHLLKTTDYNIGIIHLEEEEKRSVQGLVGYELGVAAHLPDSGLSTEDMLKAYKTLTQRDGRVHFYSHFGSDDVDVILDVIRYLVSVCQCKFIFLDHITMLVTGYETDDERKKLDFISTRLAMMTRELDFCLVLVSHVNDDGKTRGSRNISKIADLIVHIDRDVEAETIEQRNKTHLMVKGNRYAGLSGPAGTLKFDQGKFKLSELELEGADVLYDPGF
jgi:twinkle protein